MPVFAFLLLIGQLGAENAHFSSYIHDNPKLIILSLFYDPFQAFWCKMYEIEIIAFKILGDEWFKPFSINIAHVGSIYVPKLKMIQAKHRKN